MGSRYRDSGRPGALRLPRVARHRLLDDLDDAVLAARREPVDTRREGVDDRGHLGPLAIGDAEHRVSVSHGKPRVRGASHIQVQSPAMAPATAASSGPPVDERSRAEPIAAAILFSSGPLIVLEAGAKSLETADFDARAPSRIPRLSPVNHGGWGTQGGTRGSTLSPLGTARGSAQGPTAESDSRDGRAWRPTRKGLFWPLGSASVAARFAGERYVVAEPGRRRKGDPS
jgi:hypothetical protein